MEQGTYVVPIRCLHCRAVFDLWQVLQEQETSPEQKSYGATLLQQSLCLRCKAEFFEQFDTYSEDDTEEEVYDMLLDFE
jgi:hypothetical protein